MRHFIVRSREELHYMVIMDVLQIIMVVFMVGALGAVVVGVIAKAWCEVKNNGNIKIKTKIFFILFVSTIKFIIM